MTERMLSAKCRDRKVASKKYKDERFGCFHFAYVSVCAVLREEETESFGTNFFKGHPIWLLAIEI